MKAVDTKGSTGSQAVLRMHMIGIQIQDLPERIEIEAGFTESDGVDAILGQAGFFEKFRICFERYRWKIEIASRPESTMHWQE